MSNAINDSIPSVPSVEDEGTEMPPIYPDSTVGVLLRQRDDLQRSIDADRVTASIISARADASASRIEQLDRSIAELSK